VHVELHNKFLLSYLKVQTFWVLGSKVLGSKVLGSKVLGSKVLGSGFKGSGFTVKPHIKLRLAETVSRLNAQHRTSNIERRILMTLRFIDFKTSEPQPATS
jgi:hypothetical protein